MRWSTYLSPADRAEHAGVFRERTIYGLRGAASLLQRLADPGPAACLVAHGLHDVGSRRIA